MKPISVSVVVPRSREDVFAFLDDLRNHAQFLEHMLTDWSYSGPERGVGQRGRAKSKGPGPKMWADFEVVESVAPERIVERSVSSGGKRETQGTYTLQEAPEGGTRVNFEFEYLKAPLADRLAAPLTTAYLKSGNQRALEGLRERLS